MKLTITRWSDSSVIYSAESDSIGQLLAMAISDSVNLRGADLWGANLWGADLWGANLWGANLQGANLQGANLRDANLRDANLRGANLWDANLRGANLRDANLRDANLRGANLWGANLWGANLQGANLWGDTTIETGETFGQYTSKVVPALLTAGGIPLSEILIPQHWQCHSWENCPLAAAFSAKDMTGVPLLLRPRGEQFIRYFDVGLLPIEIIGKEAAK